MPLFCCIFYIDLEESTICNNIFINRLKETFSFLFSVFRVTVLVSVLHYITNRINSVFIYIVPYQNVIFYRHLMVTYYTKYTFFMVFHFNCVPAYLWTSQKGEKRILSLSCLLHCSENVCPNALFHICSQSLHSAARGGATFLVSHNSLSNKERELREVTLLVNGREDLVLSADNYNHSQSLLLSYLWI